MRHDMLDIEIRQGNSTGRRIATLTQVSARLIDGKWHVRVLRNGCILRKAELSGETGQTELRHAMLLLLPE